MPIDNNQVANVTALIERGYNYLSIEEYDNALISFNKALDLDAKGYEAYWGILLAERQCTKKDGSELIEMGMCIDNDNNYGFAYQYADDNAKNTIQSIAKSCAYMCHIRIIELIAENKNRPAFLRAEKYAMSFFASKQLVDTHTSLLRKNAFTEMTNETPRALLSLLEFYANDDVFSLLNQNKHVSKIIESMYAGFMNRLLGKIATDDEYISPEDIKADEDFKKTEKQKTQEHTDFYSLTADLTYYKAAMQEAARNYARLKHPHEYDIKYREALANVWTNPCNDPNNRYIGSDGKPGSLGDRWLFLANYLTNSNLIKKDESYTDLFFRFFDNADANGATPEICQAAKRKFVEEEARRASNLNRIDYLISKAADDYLVYWRGVEIVMSDCQERAKVASEINSFQTDIIDKLVFSWGGQAPFDFKELSPEQYDYSFISNKRLEEAIETFHRDIQVLSRLPQEQLNESEKYLSKAIELAGSNGNELKKKWDEYILDFQKECGEVTEKLKVTIAAIKDFQKKVKWRENGLCIHCGGKYKFLSKKCSICGKIKDY